VWNAWHQCELDFFLLLLTLGIIENLLSVRIVNIILARGLTQYATALARLGARVLIAIDVEDLICVRGGEGGRHNI
jgi:hypothetical protein